MPFISYSSVLVIEFTKTMHFIIFPLSLVVSTIFEIECSMAVSLSVSFITLVSASLWNILLHILKLQILILIMELTEMSKSWTACEALLFGTEINFTRTEIVAYWATYI